MEAACRGAKSEGGTTVGILPGSDPTDANPWVDIPVCTGLGYARNVIVVRSGRAVIAVGGAFGTLSEIGHALGEGIPVIGLRTWELDRDGVRDASIVVATDPTDAVDKGFAGGVIETEGHRLGGPALSAISRVEAREILELARQPDGRSRRDPVQTAPSAERRCPPARAPARTR